MRGTAITRRYGRAIFDLAQEQSLGARVLQELGDIVALCNEHAGLADVLYQPIHPSSERRSVVNAIADRGGISPLVRNFCSYLIDNGRMASLPGIAEEMKGLIDEQAGVTRGEIIAAAPLQDDELQRLRTALSARVGKELDLTVRVDPGLVGGLVAKVGDLVFDGSLRTQLEQLRSNLTKGH